MQLAVAHPSGDERLVMRQTELRLTDEDRELVEGYRSKRPAPRTKGQSSTHSFGMDHVIPEAWIMAVLGVGRSVIW